MFLRKYQVMGCSQVSENYRIMEKYFLNEDMLDYTVNGWSTFSILNLDLVAG